MSAASYYLYKIHDSTTSVDPQATTNQGSHWTPTEPLQKLQKERGELLSILKASESIY